ncbi:UDP-N-acetylmuramoyl-L-alanyl-D-glutamate--2,6-diaminopimelate ligase [Neiella marina]|uniref:UDP-N-acetylmuramoyl-L-alanyl-D-glutamate--2,6-diaminopimelate ligase n=1 Tax=Neiella holothuriorum TaxID=2870530 RepID=A0ABS7EBD0_9GAMM|nr:UDP-N-acetylmuramoyl-L-alanyl-D-glutamate--2,6-diaminopimelate ligase [Neiella holothuriorum]MBW8189530.1 UDP-N-acetylmuramoyl-L-alanyl-D-glutamate--2,6-diaminopimelate ligase [Neiella holothuriorum]
MSQRLRDIVKPWGISARVANVTARHLVLDSRQVSHGDIFVALRGHQLNGADFINAAICQGASAVLVDGDRVHVNSQWQVPVVELTQLPERLGELAASFYNNQANAPTVVGVTGTNGKTSVTHYMVQLLQALTGKEQTAGVIGTLGYGNPASLHILPNTTPDALTVHRLLSQLRTEQADWVCMEVSSHGLVQNRVGGVAFEHAVFTNLSRDHLDYHGTMEAYGEAKSALFRWPTLASSTINADDEFGSKLLDELGPSAIAYGLNDLARIQRQRQWLYFDAIKPAATGFDVTLRSSWGDATAYVPLLGRFNLSNLLAALGPLLHAGLPLEDLINGLATLRPVAGRMESFQQANMPVCIVDYAHTPDALALALQAARFHCAGELWVVFGCGGDRDKGKRPLMAQAAEQYADRIIVTADNPRSEQQQAISKDIMVGFNNSQNVMDVADRHQAIQTALRESAPQDLILIAGKGHEEYQLIGEQRLHFSDREVIQNLLEAVT